jgi:hypothetical protein
MTPRQTIRRILTAVTGAGLVAGAALLITVADVGAHSSTEAGKGGSVVPTGGRWT